MASIGTMFKRRMLSFRAKKIEHMKLDFIAPLLLLPTFFLLASLNIYSTVFVLFVIPALGTHLYLAHLARQSKSKFFFMWGIVSLFLIFICLEFLVVPLMVISPWENISFYLLLVGILCYFRMIKRKSVQSIRDGHRGESNESSGIMAHYCSVCSHRVSEKFTHCSICHVCVFGRSHHCVWINCCISVVNRKQYLILHILLLCWSCFSSLLILTTVCKSRLLNNAVLVPSDCDSAYSSLRASFSFVSAVYSLEVGALSLVSLVREVVRILGSRSVE